MLHAVRYCSGLSRRCRRSRASLAAAVLFTIYLLFSRGRDSSDGDQADPVPEDRPADLAEIAKQGRQARLEIERHVLILSGTVNETRTSHNVRLILEAFRIPFDRLVVTKDTGLPPLHKENKVGLYSVVIVEDFALYLQPGQLKWRTQLNRYCARFGCGLLFFGGPLAARRGSVDGATIPVAVTSHTGLTHTQLNGASGLLRVARDGGVVALDERHQDSVTFAFQSYHRGYRPVELMWTEPSSGEATKSSKVCRGSAFGGTLSSNNSLC